MQKNQENINPKKIIKTENDIIESEIVYTDSTEPKKNTSIKITPSNNNNNDSLKLKQDNLKIKKKKRVSFIDQIQSKKHIAQIIYINDKASLNDDKIDTSKYLEQLRKQNTNISTNMSELNKKENKNNNETYKIKRPKKSLFAKREIEKVNEQCTCIIF